MDEKISTGLGTAVILIIAITVGVFIWLVERRQSWPVIESTTVHQDQIRAEISADDDSENAETN